MHDQDNTPLHFHLTRLHHSGRWDRLAAVSHDALRQDATNPAFHYYHALALGHQNRAGEALPHIEFILKHEPTAAENHHLASIIHSGLGNLNTAANHIDTAIGINPDQAVHHYEAARISSLRLKIDDGRRQISRARELDPDDPDIAHLDITLRGATQTGSANAWESVREFEEALALDPENAWLHDSLGDIYIDGLESPRLAELHYRRAVAKEPASRTFQRDLFNAIARRDPIYRTLSLPSRAYGFLRNLGTTVRLRPWLLFFCILAIKFFAAFFLWLLVATPLFWPPAKLYEWLILRQVRQTAGTSPTTLRTWFSLRRLPFIARASITLALTLGFWILVVRILTDIGTGESIIAISAIFAAHLAFVLAATALRKIAARSTRPASRTP